VAKLSQKLAAGPTAGGAEKEQRTAALCPNLECERSCVNVCATFDVYFPLIPVPRCAANYFADEQNIIALYA
jgi:hypothetical protein